MRSSRDLRIDFFRGLALVMIFVNHVPGNVFETLTSRNFGFSDATEIFVFLAGYAAALAYSRSFAEQGFAAGGKRVLRRAGQLYVAHQISVIAAIAVIAAAAWAAMDPTYYEWINLAPIFYNSKGALIGLLTLGHQPGYFNILPLYIVLLLMLPPLFLLARRSVALMLLLSGLLWLSANLLHLNLPHYPNGDRWFLSPFGWQFLFAIGLAFGLRAKRGAPPLALRPSLFALCCLYLLAALISVRTEAGLLFDLGSASFPLGFDKAHLSPTRLVHFLALAYVTACLARRSEWFAGALCRPLVLLGQNSLHVFCLGSVVAVGAQILRFERDGGFWDDVLLIGCGILLQLGLAAYLTWQKRRFTAEVPLSNRASPAG
mgnify:CR=1 FL=1